MINYYIETALTISQVADKEVSLPLSSLLASQHRPISGWFAIRWSRIILLIHVFPTLSTLTRWFFYGNLTSLILLGNIRFDLQGLLLSPPNSSYQGRKVVRDSFCQISGTPNVNFWKISVRKTI